MNVKQSAVAALVGGAIAFIPPAPAAALTLPSTGAVVPPAPAPIGPVALPIPATSPVGADPVKKTTEERLDEIQRDLKRLTELLDGRRDETGTKLPSDPGVVEELKRLKDKIAALEKQLNDKTTALRPSTGGTPAVDALAGKGTVRVVNDYPVEITIVVNERSHRIAPNTKLDIPVPVGDFSYQLLSAGSNLTPVKSVIKEKEVVTLRIK
jgi:hypothetical protein